jgi:hypothetical protein
VRQSGLAGRLRAVAAVVFSLTTSWAWAQETPPGAVVAEPSRKTAEPPPAPPSVPIGAYPLELLGLLAPPAERGPVTLTPSISISEEFNDNIFSDNQNRQWDFITSFSPALTLYVNRPEYRLSAGYSFSADLYARESRLNNAFATQTFVATGLYQLTRGLTVTASEAFTYDRNSHRLTSQNFSTGSQEFWINHFSPGVSWQMTPLNTLGLTGTWDLLRYAHAGSGADSDTYGFQANLSHAFTQRFSGIVNYGFTYLNIRGEENSTTHTPTVGFSYALTQTLSASITGGASITLLGGDTFVNPAGTVSLVQVFSFGSASLQYNQGISVAGGFGGTNNTKTASGTLALTSLLRNLVVAFSTVYSNSESVGSANTRSVDVNSVSVNLGATYQIARYTSLFGGYTFFWQRTGSSSSTQADIDQNRVRFGLQFGYPINLFD